MQAKPFLKWAGGKTQLITDIEKALPKEFIAQKFTYVEPFVGSGAVLFWILNNFPNVEKAVINDVNANLNYLAFPSVGLSTTIFSLILRNKDFHFNP
ncbi:MAG: DNA adenine methylase [Flavobacterium sp.]|nr:DNA adenine methylase [Flavobacterium sp.]